MFTISEKESKAMVREFYKSEVFETIQPHEGSIDAIKELRDRYDKMYIVTGRQEYARSETEKWVNTYYPGLFDDIILTNSFTNHEVFKSDMCKCLNIGLIIDDNDVTCALSKYAGVSAIHFAGYDGENVYPWCHYGSDSVLDWSEVIERVDQK